MLITLQLGFLIIQPLGLCHVCAADALTYRLRGDYVCAQVQALLRMSDGVRAYKCAQGRRHPGVRSCTCGRVRHGERSKREPGQCSRMRLCFPCGGSSSETMLKDMVNFAAAFPASWCTQAHDQHRRDLLHETEDKKTRQV